MSWCYPHLQFPGPNYSTYSPLSEKKVSPNILNTLLFFNLNVYPLVPLVFTSLSNNSSILSSVNPLYTLNTSIKSCRLGRGALFYTITPSASLISVSRLLWGRYTEQPNRRRHRDIFKHRYQPTTGLGRPLTFDWWSRLLRQWVRSVAI